MITRFVCLTRALALLSIIPFLSQCSLKNYVALPDLNLGFGIGKDKHENAANDPFLPFEIRQKLVPGHTLDVGVYSGLRSPERLFSGKVMIEEDGGADFGKLGKVKLAGLDANQALRAINSLINTKHGARVINVHLYNIEDLPVITIQGSVKHPGIVRWFGSANTTNILPYVDGRLGHGVTLSITRDGQRHFYSNQQVADAKGTLKAGDVVTYSGDL